MNNFDINTGLSIVLRATSGLEGARNYLGMSAIGYCGRQAAREFLRGRGHQTDRDHQNCKRGYLIEGEFKVMLAAAGVMNRADNLPALADTNGQLLLGSERELVADFDPRFRGHTDGETVEGELVEIKSMHTEKYASARAQERIHYTHYAQVQCYMRYGSYTRAFVVYVDSGTFDHWVYSIAVNTRKGDEIEQKAKRILAAIDAGDPLQVPCECSRCDQRTTYPERAERVITAR